jgi:hypothetical protein
MRTYVRQASGLIVPSTRRRGAASNGVIVASDTFNRADQAINGNTLDNGLGGAASKTWTEDAANNAHIVTNVLKPNYASGLYHPAWIDTSVTSHGLSFKFTGSLGSNNHAIGAALRLTDANNFYLVEIYRVTGVSFLYNFSKFVAGVETAISNVAFATPLNSGDTVLTQIVGTLMTIKVNGTTMATATDSTFTTQTKCGVLFVGTGVDSLIGMDDVIIRSY